MYRLSDEFVYLDIVKIWLLILLFLPAVVAAQSPAANPDGSVIEETQTSEDELLNWEAISPDEDEILEEIREENIEEDINWVDDSHAFVTDQAQALTEWMDEFFGDPTYDVERAESLLRLELIDDWESDGGHDVKIRLRGKLQLPKISRRLNLVFSGQDSEFADEADRDVEDAVGLQYELREGGRSRVDLTMGLASGNLRPGVKYRSEAPIDDRHSYRFVERLQYEDGEGFYSITQLDLNRVRNEDSVWRFSNRGIWGENTDGVEWRTRLALRTRYNIEARRPYAINYFGSIRGITRPDSYVKNYRLGLTWRRQVYRDFLFMELEPAINYRRPNLDKDRDIVWGFVVRLEIALERDLRRVRRIFSDDNVDEETVSPEPQ
ncbi:MAG: hypothetical protein ABJK25_19275 [Halieaceae bacterium]